MTPNLNALRAHRRAIDFSDALSYFQNKREAIFAVGFSIKAHYFAAPPPFEGQDTTL